MNKKFLSAILFGALMVSSTGTFVSCKDYDDDIDNLQEQINKLATKEDMTSQIATLQAALTAAQTEATAAKTTAEQALAKANSIAETASDAEKAAAKAAADAAQAALDAANAKTEAIKAAKDEVAKVKAELEAAIGAQFDAEKVELAKTINALTEKVEKMTGLTTGMITSINLQEGAGDKGGNDTYYGSRYLDLKYNQMPAKWTVGDKEVKSIVFGKDLSGEITINAEELFSKSTTFLISVSPANAAVAPEMLSLINSKGESLDSYLDLQVKKYDGLLVRSAAGTGLHAVTASLKKNVDLKAFAKAVNGDEYTWTEEGGEEHTDNYKIRFAVAATKEGRTVTSTYDLGVYAYRESEGLCDLAENSTIKSSIESEDYLTSYTNYSPSTTPNDEWCYPVVAGEDFQIAVNPKCNSVLASYITVDMDNTNLSTTDKAAIKGLTIKGVDAVSQTNKFNVNISGDNAKGVVVPLKVTAMGFNGYTLSTVVWVKAGNSSEVAQTASYVVTPIAKVSDATAYSYSGKANFTVPTSAAKFDLTVYAKDEINISVSKQDVLNNATFKFLKSDGKTTATAVKDIAVAQLNATVNLQTLKDSKVYEGTVKFFDKEGTFLSQSTIKVQKVLPTVLPEGFSIKTNQLDAQGVYNCYLIPDAWAATTATTTNGTMEMSHVFNFGKADAADYEITFAEAQKDKDGKKDGNKTVTGAEKLTVANSYIDNKKQHTTTVVYSYGAISSEQKDGKFVDYTVDAASFPTVFNCIYNYVTPTYSWRWATLADLNLKATDKLPYKTTLTYGTNSYTGESTGLTADAFAKYIKGVSSRDGQYSAFLSAPYEKSLKIKEAHLVSNGNKEVDEYFNVEITANGNDIKGFTATSVSNETNPTAAVASTLKVTVYDMYGHEYVIELPMTVNPR